jgi:hypothetical protein
MLSGKQGGCVGDEAFNQGQAARATGMPSRANPYEAETLAFYHWEEGWEDIDVADQERDNA